MSGVDRSRLGRIVAAANNVQLVTLSPTDTTQARHDQVRRLTADAARSSDKRAVLLIAVEQ
jgi:hypothetical protein